jgi:hypothetical protein
MKLLLLGCSVGGLRQGRDRLGDVEADFLSLRRRGALLRPMSSIFVFRRFSIIRIGALSILFSCLAGAAERPQMASPPISPVKVTTLIKLLEQAHINRAAVRPPGFAAVVEVDVAVLDPERIFFPVTDRAALNASHGQAI